MTYRHMSTIKPSDLHDYGDPLALRDRWTVAKMRYVVEALAGATVAVECDSRTGFTVEGVLEAAFDGGPTRGGRLTVRSEYGGTHYYLPQVGVIVVLDDGAGMGAKWRAIAQMRDDRHEAVTVAGLSALPEGWGARVAPTDRGTLVTLAPSAEQRRAGARTRMVEVARGGAILRDETL